ncbi:MAG: TonB-dependent receptor plug domain-containing protein [Woeseiaceae bacterium]
MSKRVFGRSMLSLAVASALGSATMVAPAFAQEDEAIEEVVVIGSRSRPRSVTESAVPVDVITADEFINQGGTDLSDLLRNVVPSYNVNTQPISDAATIVRPANLRGLAPDHTLVLVNGKRRHRAAVIYWLGNGVSDGAQGPDLSVIPSIALKQVEVLRDGASAQYGSDAIAGVMNFVLRDDNSGGSVEARYGSFYEGDGDQVTISGNIGLPVGDSGFVNLSAEYGSTDDTDRSIQRDDAAGLIAAGNTAVANPAQIWGSPIVDDDLKLFANFGMELAGGTTLYSHGNFASKTVDGGFYFRNPNNRGSVYSTDGGATLLVGDVLEANGGAAGAAGCPVVTITDNIPDPTALAQVFADPNCFTFQELFPGGFTPRFGGDVTDFSIVGGLKGEMDNGLIWDASVGFGSNEVDFFINNTINASLGPNTPTNFDPGSYTQEELNVNFDVSYQVNDQVNVAGGVEYRDENFEIGIGQLESFQIGPFAAQGFSAASNGFPGFGDIAAGDWSRSNYAAYGDVEIYPVDNWLVGVAARFEDFDDFGSTFNYKVATNYRLNDNIAVRGSISTGFRAPTPGQSNAFNVSTEFDVALGDLVNNGTIPATNPVAVLFGGQPLDPEESLNFTAGTILETGPITLTVDFFQIDLKDRITVSQLFSINDLSAQQLQDLINAGVTSAENLQNFRFFTNDFETRTSGVDLVATTSLDFDAGTTDVSFTYNRTKTEVTDFNDTTLDATRIRELEQGLPESRWTLSANTMVGDWRFLVRTSYFDEWFDSEDNRKYGNAILVDAEAAWQFADHSSIVVGAQNIFDTVPEVNPGAAAGVGNLYSQFSPFGFNGGFYYLRYRYSFD